MTDRELAGPLGGNGNSGDESEPEMQARFSSWIDEAMHLWRHRTSSLIVVWSVSASGVALPVLYWIAMVFFSLGRKQLPPFLKECCDITLGCAADLLLLLSGPAGAVLLFCSGFRRISAEDLRFVFALCACTAVEWCVLGIWGTRLVWHDRTLSDCVTSLGILLTIWGIFGLCSALTPSVQ